MRSRLYRFYRYSLYGAFGGYVGACLHQILFIGTLSRPLAGGERFRLLAVLGCAIGAAIGFFPSFLDGRSQYAFGGAVRSGLIGAALGGAGGMLALPLAEWLHIRLGGGFQGRATALVALGLLIGVAEGVNGGARFWRGVLGGGFGGLIAGVGLELLLPIEAIRAQVGVVALILLGLSIAAFIALFVNVLQDAWLEREDGSKVGGHSYPLGKFREPAEAYIGSDIKGSLYIWIADAQPRHASITLTKHGARLRHCAPAGVTLVDGVAVSERMLEDGEVIQVGRTRLRYRERRRRSSPAASPAIRVLGSG